MKRKTFQCSRTKRQLMAKKHNGVPYVIWKLSKDQLEFVRSMGYFVSPYIYKVKVNELWGRKPSSTILKELHFAHKYEHRDFLYKKLSHKDMKILEEYGIKFWPYKYKIVLND